MEYALWRELTLSVGVLIGLLGFFRSLEQRKEQRFLESIRELSNPDSAMLRAAAASQLPKYFSYRVFGILHRPYYKQALAMALHGLKEENEVFFVRQELINSAHFMINSLKTSDSPKVNLIGSNLDKLIMHNFVFDKIDLTDVSLKECDLGSTSFVGSKLWKTSFTNSNLSSANLNDAKLWDADFKYTNLEGASILTEHINNNTDFTGANFKNTKISKTIAEICNLKEQKGCVIKETKGHTLISDFKSRLNH